jgi:hypothetical protein
MPILISNRLYVKNTGPEFSLLRSIFTKEVDPFNKLSPIPKVLEREIGGYAPEDRLEWCLVNWGTKWDAQELEVVYSGEDEFCVNFISAFSSPAMIYAKLATDFPNCLYMVFAWSIRENFMTCASAGSGKYWAIEQLGELHNGRLDFYDPPPQPSQDFYEFARQFKTPVPGSFEAIPRVPMLPPNQR